jgi:tetratricopeptide (TPR) repeat protein
MIRYQRFLTTLALAGLALTTSGCAGSISHWIVAQRDHQGDVSVADGNIPDASVAYGLALRIDPHDSHARSAFITVQAKLANQLFAASRYEEALAALRAAAKYAPDDDRIVGLMQQIAQAQINQKIVASNYPSYKTTETSIAHSIADLKTLSLDVDANLKRFDATYDTNQLTETIRSAYELEYAVKRLERRLLQYRELVDTGVPESSSESAQSGGSLLPLP